MKLIRRLLPVLLLAQAMVLPAAQAEPVPAAFAVPGKDMHRVAVNPEQKPVEEVQTRGRWAEAALLARPLIFDHEDHPFLHGERGVGNFGVWVPAPVNLPPAAALERYRNSERVTIDFIVGELGVGAEKNLTTARMAQLYAFVHNVTPGCASKMLARFKSQGFASAQTYMNGVVRAHGSKTVLRGLEQRRADERKLGEGLMTAQLSRRMPNGQPYTLAALQGRYDRFVEQCRTMRAKPKSAAVDKLRAAKRAGTPVRYDAPRKLRVGAAAPSPA